jgi:hypothetical protein
VFEGPATEVSATTLASSHRLCGTMNG